MIESLFLTVLVLALAGISVVLVVYILRLRGQTTLIDDLPDAVLTINRSGLITHANPAIKKILGQPGTSLIGQSVIDQLPIVEPLLLEAPQPDGERFEVALGEGKAARTYDIKVIIRQNNKGENIGWLVTLHDITRPKQIEGDLFAQKQRYERLLAVARATTERPSVEETLQNTLDVTASLTTAEYGSLLLLDKDGVVIQGILALGKMIPGQEKMVRQILDHGLAGWVAENKRTAIVHDTNQDDRWLPAEDKTYVARSALAVPILSQDTLIGILTLTHSAPYHFREEDAQLLETAGEQLALAMRNAQLYDEQRSLAARQTTLYEVLRNAGSHLNPTQVASEAVDIITQLTGWTTIAVLTSHGSESDLLVSAATGSLTDWINKKIPLGHDPTGLAFRTGEKQYVPEAPQEHGTAEWPPQAAAYLAVPLRRGDITLGVLEIHSQTPYPFNQLDLQLAVSVAEAISMALDNARYHGAMRKHAADLNALYAVNRMIGRSMDLDEMLSKSLYSALTSLGFAFGFIGLFDPANDQLTLVSQRNVPMELLEFGNLENSFASYVFQQNRGVFIPDLTSTSAEFDKLQENLPDFVERLKKLNVRSLVGVPLDHQRNSLGVLCMFSRKIHQFAANDLALQITIGQQIGMAVSHSRLFNVVSEERSLLQALIDSSRDGIVMLGANNKILVANKPALDFLLIPGQPDDWINRPFIEAMVNLRRESIPQIQTLIDELGWESDQKTFSGSGDLELSSRSIRWQNLPVWSGDTFLGRLLVLYDVTDEKALNQVREDLVHTMVHDLRNPLTNIFGSLEFLGDEVGPQLSPDHQQVFDIARSNANDMVQMVTDILEINRLESGQMPLDQKPISIPNMLKSVILAQTALAMNNNISIDYEIMEDLPLAWADGRLFERVLQNLLDNAIRFTPAGGHIRVSARQDTGLRNWLLISVCDGGPGIPDDVRERIFLKFTTARHQLSGTGLGLSFCKMVVEAHGGRIWAENNPDLGSTFYFTLPPLPSASSRLKREDQKSSD